MSMRAIIVDDEELARRGIRALLKRAGDVEIVSECGSGEEAIKAIGATEPELVYLDVQMPGKTGFDVIAALGETKCPHIVFVTAFDKFAVQAFEIHALDYLLKPVNEARFNESLARARAAVAGKHDGSMMRRFWQMATELRAAPDQKLLPSVADRIPVKTRGRVIIVNVADIDWVEAEGNYVSVHAGAKNWLLRETIAAAEARLALSGFVRIHRSTLVNIWRVRELLPLSKGEFTVVLNDGTELKLSRNYRFALESLLGKTL
ncbi:MAG TPA: LytTR family transcriptional regulator DNA-binding domain-containing protein [Steroidobacteraceae bacterium]|jgi:two-component system LytT family response regulator|nr:LytTR family transcriptional regulator DNA-binding domain-containing protein [Steroidobacteraceae bacterium]